MSVKVVPLAALEKAALCGSGSAEWLGHWVPGGLEGADSASACVVDALASIAVNAWAAVWVE